MINNPNICVVGLGYVGTPLAVEFGKKYRTIGFDNNTERIEQLKINIDKTLEVDKEVLNESKITFTTEYKDIIDCNIYIVTVPTPVDKYNKPDMRPLASATKTVGKVLKEGNIVIFESTVYPGATEEFCVPILNKVSGLKYNSNFFCGYSPERVNPGDREHSLTTIKKVTSGSNNNTANFVDKLYNSIIPAGTHLVPSIAIAEAAKVIENIQRDVNIALINELAMLFNKIDLDTNDILKAAGTKWNFIPFSPGLVGGHCIGVDPYYLTHKAEVIGYRPDIILAGRRINDSMGEYIAENTIIEMTKVGINPLGAKVAILGITFKENCPDLRNTKVPDIISYLKTYGCEIKVTDSIADSEEAKKHLNIDLIQLDEITENDVVIVSVAHNNYKDLTEKKMQNIIIENGVLIDVKSIYEKNFFANLKLNHWRL